MTRFIPAVVAAALLLPAAATAQGTSKETTSLTATAVGTTVKSHGTPKLLIAVDGAAPCHRTGAGALDVRSVKGGSLATGTIYDDVGSFEVRLLTKAGPTGVGGTRTYSGTGTIVSGTGLYADASGSFRITGGSSSTGVRTLKFRGRYSYTPSSGLVISCSGRGQ